MNRFMPSGPGPIGLAPATLPLPVAGPSLVAVGARRGSAVTPADGARAVLGPHIGDLSDAPALEAYDVALDHLRRIYGIEPVCAAHDLNPGYLATRLAQRWPHRLPQARPLLLGPDARRRRGRSRSRAHGSRAPARWRAQHLPGSPRQAGQ
ncbi:hypothetical protein [Nonomuraea sp. NPDC050643]|uniref:hypothetical protein n=1 Tax=Nonomuraea sp. NPDC050643 TaxID=3155660 RepID=UPI00340ADE74